MSSPASTPGSSGRSSLSDSENDAKRPGLGQRHLLAGWLALGFILLYSQLEGFNVALVAMVRNASAPPPNATGPPTFAWTRDQQGLLLSAFFWGYLLLPLPGGAFAQRYSAKWLLCAGLGLNSALFLAVPAAAAAGGPYLLFALVVAEGAAASVALPACLALLGRWAPPRESSSLMTVALCGLYLGTVVGQLSAGGLCARASLGWPAVFYLGGGLGLLWLVPWALLTADSPAAHPRIGEAERAYILRSLNPTRRSPAAPGLPWRRLLLSPALWVYYVDSFLACWIVFTLMSCLPQFLAEALGYDIAADGLVCALPFAGAFLSSNCLTQVSDRLAARPWPGRTAVRKLFTVAPFLGCAAAFVGLARATAASGADGGRLVVGLLVLGYSALAGVHGGVYAAPLDLCPEFAGAIFGVRNVFASLAGIGGPMVADALTPNGTRDEWVAVFYISAGAAFLGALVHAAFGSAERQVWGPPADAEAPLLLSGRQAADYGATGPPLV